MYYKQLFGDTNIDINKVNNKTKNLAKQIRNIIEPVVIRRNRLGLNYYPEKIDLPEVKEILSRSFLN